MTEGDLTDSTVARADEPEGIVSDGNGGLSAFVRRFNPFFAGIATFVVMGVFLRVTRMHAELWMDEGATWAETSTNTFGALFHYLMNAHTGSERLAPLYYCLVYFWRELFGDSEASLHLLSILLSVASVVLLVDAARRLFGESAALWAAAVSGSSAFLVAYGGFIRPYAMVIFFTCVVVDAWAADCTSVRSRKGPVGWCAVGAAMLTAGIAFSFIPLTMMALCDWRLRSDSRRWLRLWGPSAALSIPICLGLYGGWIFSGGQLSVPDRQGLLISLLFAIYGVAVGETYGPPVQALHGAHQIDAILEYWPRLVLLAGVLTCLAVNIVRVLSRPGRDASPGIQMLALQSLVFTLLGSVLLGTALGYFAHLDWLPRHAFYAAPMLVLIVAALPKLDVSPLAGTTPVGVLILLNAISIVNMNFRPQYGLDDYAGVARYLNSPDVRGSKPVMVSGFAPLLRDYYHVSRLNEIGVGPEQLGASLKSLTGGASDVTVVINRQWDWARGGLDAVQAHCYELREHRKFNYFDVYRMTMDDRCS
jgi:4-amino-4-deoxy-L-arabinose transferase-like glycosyltransferase